LQLSQQLISVQALSVHLKGTVGCAGPAISGLIPVELNAVSIGILQVEGFADPVVNDTLYLNACAIQ
jgi:hypothetical protein